MPHSFCSILQRPSARAIAFALMAAIGLGATARADSLVLDRRQIDAVADVHGPDAAQRLRQWRALIVTLPRHTRSEQLQRVNAFVNAVAFVNDAVQWGKEDFWATPAELLRRNGGDCEDLAIAKYFTLRAAGVPVERMRITYVKARTLNQGHMVLAYYPSAGTEPLVLDNIDPEIKPASQRTDLLAVYSFNGDDLWLTEELHGPARRVGNAERIGRWRQLLARMEMETLH